ncbi:hypothetical protein EDC04DRAFT_2607023 [Pisolithus marmoratus]|nr:hypothetical protein EDC04DRAFT_2607023 [Pisolithus marmoratus]
MPEESAAVELLWQTPDLQQELGFDVEQMAQLAQVLERGLDHLPQVQSGEEDDTCVGQELQGAGQQLNQYQPGTLHVHCYEVQRSCWKRRQCNDLIIGPEFPAEFQFQPTFKTDNLLSVKMSLVLIHMDGRYHVREQLGTGMFASVYKAVNIFTNKPYTIKLELSMTGKSSVELEYKVLQDLNSRCGIPHTHWFGREANYDALVLDLLGPLLHNLMNKHKKFHLCTVLYLADQLISFHPLKLTIY